MMRPKGQIKPSNASGYKPPSRVFNGLSSPQEKAVQKKARAAQMAAEKTAMIQLVMDMKKEIDTLKERDAKLAQQSQREHRRKKDSSASPPVRVEPPKAALAAAADADNDDNEDFNVRLSDDLSAGEEDEDLCEGVNSFRGRSTEPNPRAHVRTVTDEEKGERERSWRGASKSASPSRSPEHDDARSGRLRGRDQGRSPNKTRAGRGVSVRNPVTRRDRGRAASVEPRKTVRQQLQQADDEDLAARYAEAEHNKQWGKAAKSDNQDFYSSQVPLPAISGGSSVKRGRSKRRAQSVEGRSEIGEIASASAPASVLVISTDPAQKQAPSQAQAPVLAPASEFASASAQLKPSPPPPQPHWHRATLGLDWESPLRSAGRRQVAHASPDNLNSFQRSSNESERLSERVASHRAEFLKREQEQLTEEEVEVLQASLRSLQIKLTRSTEAVLDLEGELNAEKASRHHQEQRTAELDSKLADVRQTLAETQNSLKQTTVVNDGMTRFREQQDAQMQRMSHDAENREERNLDLTARLLEADSYIQSVSRGRDLLVAQMQEQLDVSQTSLFQEKSQVVHLRARLSVIEAENATHMRKLEQNEAAYRLSAEATALAHHNEIRRLEERVLAYADKAKQLLTVEAQVSFMETESVEQRNAISLLQQELGHSRAARQERDQRYSQLELKVQSQLEQLYALDVEIRQKNQEYIVLRGENEHLARENNAAAEANYALRRAHADDPRDDVQSWRAIWEEETADLRNRASKADELRDELDKQRVSSMEMHRQIIEQEKLLQQWPLKMEHFNNKLKHKAVMCQNLEVQDAQLRDLLKVANARISEQFVYLRDLQEAAKSGERDGWEHLYQLLSSMIPFQKAPTVPLPARVSSTDHRPPVEISAFDQPEHRAELHVAASAGAHDSPLAKVVTFSPATPPPPTTYANAHANAHAHESIVKRSPREMKKLYHASDGSLSALSPGLVSADASESEKLSASRAHAEHQARDTHAHDDQISCLIAHEHAAVDAKCEGEGGHTKGGENYGNKAVEAHLPGDHSDRKEHAEQKDHDDRKHMHKDHEEEGGKAHTEPSEDAKPETATSAPHAHDVPHTHAVAHSADVVSAPIKHVPETEEKKQLRKARIERELILAGVPADDAHAASANASPEDKAPSAQEEDQDLILEPLTPSATQTFLTTLQESPQENAAEAPSPRSHRNAIRVSKLNNSDSSNTNQAESHIGQSANKADVVWNEAAEKRAAAEAHAAMKAASDLKMRHDEELKAIAEVIAQANLATAAHDADLQKIAEPDALAVAEAAAAAEEAVAQAATAAQAQSQTGAAAEASRRNGLEFPGEDLRYNERNDSKEAVHAQAEATASADEKKAAEEASVKAAADMAASVAAPTADRNSKTGNDGGGDEDAGENGGGKRKKRPRKKRV